MGKVTGEAKEVVLNFEKDLLILIKIKRIATEQPKGFKKEIGGNK